MCCLQVQLKKGKTKESKAGSGDVIVEGDHDEEEEVSDDDFNSDEEHRPRNWRNIGKPQTPPSIASLLQRDQQPLQLQQSTQSYDDEFDPLFPDYQNLPQSLATTGVRLAGATVKEASQGTSMLKLLRTYHEVAEPGLPSFDDLQLESYANSGDAKGLSAFRQLEVTTSSTDEIKYFDSDRGKLAMHTFDNTDAYEDN